MYYISFNRVSHKGPPTPPIERFYEALCTKDDAILSSQFFFSFYYFFIINAFFFFFNPNVQFIVLYKYDQRPVVVPTGVSDYYLYAYTLPIHNNIFIIRTPIFSLFILRILFTAVACTYIGLPKYTDQ